MSAQSTADAYLEAILLVENRFGAARAADVAREMERSRSSVSAMVRRLHQQQLLTVDEGGFLRLTPLGRQRAGSAFERRDVFTQFLVRHGVSLPTARRDAAAMERVLSQETYEIMFHRVKNHTA